jgi:hypothetical protein
VRRRPKETEKDEVMIYSYVVEHDLGFAPNPFHGVCSLACCKPQIRKVAKEGDYIIGTGAARPKLTAHLTFWMRVEKIIPFDEYWADRRFRRKKPVMGGTNFLRYGDNIYHRDANGDYQQEYSFHSLEDGSVSVGDLHRDTGTTDRVLLGREYAFWGRSGIKLPDELTYLVKKGPSHKCNFSSEEVQTFLHWLDTHPERGVIDEPAHWQFLGLPKRKRSKKSNEMQS